MLGPDTLAFAPEIPKDLAAEAGGDEDDTSVPTVAGKKPVSKWRGESMYPKLLQGNCSTYFRH